MPSRVISGNHSLSDVLDRREQIRLRDFGVDFDHVRVILTIFRGIFAAITRAGLHIIKANFTHAFLDYAFLN
jgi:hypothetical protein